MGLLNMENLPLLHLPSVEKVAPVHLFTARRLDFDKLYRAVAAFDKQTAFCFFT